MSAAPIIAGLGLGAVFAVAAIAKLADPEGSRTAVEAFGVPRRLVGPIGTLLPLAEFATAALLFAGAAGSTGVFVAGALSALVLLTAFCAGIAFSLFRGQAPACHCFGQLHSAPVSERTLARNGLLLGAAAFVASEGDLVRAALACGATLALITLLATQRDRRAHASRWSADAVPSGTQAPGFELAAVEGPSRSLAELLRPGRPLMLVFTDPVCGPCIALAPRIAAWQRDRAGDLTIAVIESRGGNTPATPDPYGRQNVLLQQGSRTAEEYGVQGTPTGVLIGADGVVISEAASGGREIEALVGHALSGEKLPEAVASAAPGEMAFLRRRELITRAVAGWAAAAGLIATPALAGSGQAEIKCRHRRCGNRCCPRHAKCGRRGNRDVCICPDGRPACRNRCCPETFVCRRRGRRRRCICPDGYAVCSGRCVPVHSNPLHCGRCGRECPTGTSCVDGECVGGDGSGSGSGGSGGCDCPLGQACCEGECTDLNASEEHCGECGRTCPGGQTCCEGHCRSIVDDPQNCGRCGRRCPSDEVCSEGQCRRRCRQGLRNCQGHCVDTTTDSRHCGGCQPCNGPFDTGECCNGECCDYNGSTCCPGGCKNLALDDENCGACGNACPPGSFCRFGTCSPL